MRNYMLRRNTRKGQGQELFIMRLLSRVIMTERAPLPVLLHAPPLWPVFNFIVKFSYEKAFSSASSLAGKESIVGRERHYCPLLPLPSTVTPVRL